MASTETQFNELPEAEQKRLKRKLEKLKALSECRTGNANEAATAAATMSRIMIEYQIAEFTVEENNAKPLEMTDHAFFKATTVALPKWQVHLLLGIGRAHDCEPYISGKTKGKQKCWKILGTTSDITDVKQLWVYCVKEIHHLVYEWGMSKATRERNDFMMGAAVGVIQAIKAARLAIIEEAQTSTAMVLFETKADTLAKKVKEYGLVAIKKSSRGREVDMDSFDQGVYAGSTISLNKKLDI